MSTFTGVWQWRGRPIEDSRWALQVTHSNVPGLPSHSETLRRTPSLAFHAQVHHFDQIARRERQPYVATDGTIVTWDGRLDNREDLLLTLHSTLMADRSDVALVAAAYARWGGDCLARLLGDWSVAIWDAQQQLLLLAQDYMGNRPLYYRTTADGIAWASRLGALVAGGDLYDALDETYLASVLVVNAPRGATPFADTHVLRGGHVLTARPEHVDVRRWWTLTPARYQGSEHTYAEQARQLLTDAVRVRLRASGTVWAELSGGWDSSSVVCLAHTLIAEGLVEATALETITMVLSTTADDPDVTPFLAPIERWRQRASRLIDYRGMSDFATLLAQRQYYPVGGPVEDVASLDAVGRGILLDGVTGDFAMPRLGSSVAIFELLHTGYPWQAWQAHRQYARDYRRPVFRSLLRHARYRYAHKWRARQYHRSANARHRRWCVEAAAAGVHARLVAATPPLDRLEDDRDLHLADFPLTKRDRVRHLYGLQGRKQAIAERYPLVWKTDPYSHRPLIEFVLSLPETLFWKPGEIRPLMRRALADVLPPDSLRIVSQSSADAVKANREARLASCLAQEQGLMGQATGWELVRREYVAAAPLAAALRELFEAGRLRPSLRRWIPLEAWLRTLPTLAQTPPSPAGSETTDVVSIGGR